MKFIISEIRNKAFTAIYSFDDKVDVSELVSMDNDIRNIDLVQVKGTCAVDGEELIFSYTITGTMVLPCARTLVDVNHSFSFQVTDVFTTTALTKSDEEDLVHLITEDVLDLTPYIIENIILETPFRVFSDEKVIEKGQGWAYFTEETLNKEKAKKVDPRLAKLKDLVIKDNDES